MDDDYWQDWPTGTSRVPVQFEWNAKYHMSVQRVSKKPDNQGRPAFMGVVDINSELYPAVMFYETKGSPEKIGRANKVMPGIEAKLGGQDTDIELDDVLVRVFSARDNGLCLCVPWVYTVGEAHKWFKSDKIFLANVINFNRSDKYPMVVAYKANGDRIKGFISSDHERHRFTIKIYERNIKDNLKTGDVVLVRDSESKYDLESGLYLFDPALHIEDQDSAQAGPEGVKIKGGSLGSFFTEIGDGRISNLYVVHQSDHKPGDAVGYINRPGDSDIFISPVVVERGAEQGLVGKIIQAEITGDLKPRRNLMFARATG